MRRGIKHGLYLQHSYVYNEQMNEGELLRDKNYKELNEKDLFDIREKRIL